MQTNLIQQEPSQTIGGVLRSKALDHVAKNSVMRSLRFCVAFAFLLVFAVSPEAFFQLLQSLWVWHGNLLPKVSFCWAAVKHFGSIWAFSRSRIKKRSRDLKRTNQTGCRVVGGVPADEILDLLFKIGAFPAKDVQARFGVSTHGYQEIVAELSQAGLIERGDFNSWVLAKDFTRARASAFIDSSAPAIIINQ